MESNAPAMPTVMTQLHKIQLEYWDKVGIDFEPYEKFLSPENTQTWFQAWTGNVDADASQFLVFGQDGTGGYAAFWLIRDNKELLTQPIIFLGSEGEMGVVAQSFSDYLWLLANGYGPYEAVAELDGLRNSSPELMEFAKQHAITQQSKPSEIVGTAKAEFPDFVQLIMSICK